MTTPENTALIEARDARIAALELRLVGARAVDAATHFHESGHAVAMCALGCPPDSATIVASGRASGMVSRGATKTTAGDYGVVLMAGLVATAEYLKRAGLPCDEEALAGAASHDLADIKEMLLTNALDCDLAVFIKLATTRAATLLEAHWPRVERVANALVEHRTLDREHIQAAFEEAA